MQPIIQPWAYPFPPAAWARFATYQRKQEPGLSPRAAYQPGPDGRVPVWPSVTGGLQGGDFTWLIVRVLPEYELVISSEHLCDPAELKELMQRRAPGKSWPVREWRLSHIVYLTRPTGRATRPAAALRRARRSQIVERHCFARLPDRRGRWQQLAFITVPKLAVSVAPARDKETPWDVSFRVSRKPEHLPTWFQFVVALATHEPWERQIIFRVVGHLLGASFVEMLEDTCRLLCGRIATLADKPHASFELATETLQRLAGTSAEPYRYPCRVDWPSDPTQASFFTSLLALQRSPMQVTFVRGAKKLNLLQVMKRSGFLPPQAFTRKGIPRGLSLCYSRCAIDCVLDQKERVPLYRMSILPPYGPRKQ